MGGTSQHYAHKWVWLPPCSNHICGPGSIRRGLKIESHSSSLLNSIIVMASVPIPHKMLHCQVLMVCLGSHQQILYIIYCNCNDYYSIIIMLLFLAISPWGSYQQTMVCSRNYCNGSSSSKLDSARSSFCWRCASLFVTKTVYAPLVRAFNKNYWKISIK